MGHGGTTGLMIARAARLKLFSFASPRRHRACSSGQVPGSPFLGYPGGFHDGRLRHRRGPGARHYGLARAARSSLVHPPGHGADAISPQGITALVLPSASGTGAVFAFLNSLAVVAGAAVLFVSCATVHRRPWPLNFLESASMLPR